jgi:hypothetical protein
MKRKVDKYCKCGHNKKAHQYPGAFTWIDSWCTPCGASDSDYLPLCVIFIEDNLITLEHINE